MTFVIPDLHGKSELLSMALDAIGQRASAGHVVFLGDYIDRGPDSRGVIKRVSAGAPAGWTWTALSGNHEQMACDAYRDGDFSLWRSNGGAETLLSYGGLIDPADLRWMEQRPRVYWDHHRVYVHAAVSESHALDDQPDRTTHWQRYPKNADIGYNDKHVVHGHTPQKEGALLLTKRTNLDTGAVFTDHLAVGVFLDDVPGGPVEVLDLRTGCL